MIEEQYSYLKLTLLQIPSKYPTTSSALDMPDFLKIP
jgi:hypothetical protein